MGYILFQLEKYMWEEGKAKTESRLGVQKWGGWYWGDGGHGSVVPF